MIKGEFKSRLQRGSCRGSTGLVGLEKGIDGQEIAPVASYMINVSVNM